MIRNFLLVALGLTILAARSDAMAASNHQQCAVVGVGVLGTSLCQQLLTKFDTVHGITKTATRHAAIREAVASEGLVLQTRDECERDQKYTNVVFCAPPSGFDDYPAAVRDAAANLWAGPEGGGVFVFTSSGAVYGAGEGNVVTENSPVADAADNPRVARLVNAEAACIEAGGCVLRLAGLYNLQRGAHNFWLTSGKPVAGSPSGIVNLLHYEDAAASCFAAVAAGPWVCNGKVFLISDGKPPTRREICASALKASVYKGYEMPAFEMEDGPASGKVYDGSASNAALSWSPKYASFDAFVTANA